MALVFAQQDLGRATELELLPLSAEDMVPSPYGMHNTLILILVSYRPLLLISTVLDVLHHRHNAMHPASVYTYHALKLHVHID